MLNFTARSTRVVNSHPGIAGGWLLPWQGPDPHDDIDATIDLIGETFSEFVPLLQAQSYLQLTPEIQEDWRAVFRVPWMPR